MEKKETTTTNQGAIMGTIEIELGNIGSENQVKRTKALVEGKTYFNFKVHYSPDAGNFPTFVTTDYEIPETDEEVEGLHKEAKEALLFLLATSI